MLATVEKIVGLIIKSISAYAAGAAKAEKMAFGRELAELHFRLLDVIGDGEEIVASLEYYVARYRAKGPTSKESWELRSEGYLKLLRAQSVNLKRLSASVERLQRVISLLGHQQDELEDYIAFKYNALFYFADTLDRGLVPDNFDPAAFLDLMENAPANTGAGVQPAWDDKAFLAISKFLADQKPREALDALKIYQKKIQELITANFSIDEILKLGEFKPRSNLYNFGDRFR